MWYEIIQIEACGFDTGMYLTIFNVVWIFQGDGIEFKRHFLEIKKALVEIVK